MEHIQKVIDLLEHALDENSSQAITAGDIIKTGYNSEVDTYRKTVTQSHEWLSHYQSKISSQTGISSLKIKYTNVAGYFIEVPKSQVSLIPDEFIHKQTLVNASRYVTQELSDFQNLLLEAQGNMARKEYEVFQEVRETVLESFSDIKTLAESVSYIDFIASLASCAYSNNYVCPNVSNDYSCEITAGRHPVIETIEKEFVKNDMFLQKKDFLHIITGPNMWWKSTFLRQNALIILMAHIGSFVPACSANIGLVDKIFSRVWANDNLFLGKSTFMVEMQEVAYILHNATDKSFIIIDEVWRGTSTYDGMSLAWWILKYIHDRICAKTLFATHYHEIIDESQSLVCASNYSVAVWEENDTLVFLRKIIAGGIAKSYGLEVAKIAGIWKCVIDEAHSIIDKHQYSHTTWHQMTLDIHPEKDSKSDMWLIDKILSTDINTLTPIEALQFLSDVQKDIQKTQKTWKWKNS